MDQEDKMGAIGWVAIALVLAALVGVFVIVGCSDKETFRTIREVLPEIDKPPVECGPKECRHGNECVPCEDDGR